MPTLLSCSRRVCGKKDELSFVTLLTNDDDDKQQPCCLRSVFLARHHSKQVIHINSFQSSEHPYKRQVVVSINIIPICTDERADSDRLSNLPEDAQLGRGRE